MNDKSRMITAAQRKARRLAKKTASLTYQQALDRVARDLGKAHWSDYLADPVEVPRDTPLVLGPWETKGTKKLAENPDTLVIIPTSTGKKEDRAIPANLQNNHDVAPASLESMRFKLEKIVGGLNEIISTEIVVNDSRVITIYKEANDLVTTLNRYPVKYGDLMPWAFKMLGLLKVCVKTIQEDQSAPAHGMVINELKPELPEKYHFTTNWKAIDKNLPADVDDGTTWHPRFNVLSEKYVEGLTPKSRENYISKLVEIMLPSHLVNHKNEYFENIGRKALEGFLIAEIERAKRENRTAHITSLIDWINADQQKAADQQDSNPNGDPIGFWLKSVVDNINDVDMKGYAMERLYPLVSMAPRERSGMLGIVDKAFAPFKSAEARKYKN